MKQISYWLERKLSQQVLILKESVTVTQEYKKVTGGRSFYAKIVLSSKPANSFSFTSEAIWPEEKCDDDVLTGILDVLLSSDKRSVLGCEFILEEIVWHEIDSNGYAYYIAARQATERVLRRGEYPDNISYE
jgi:elongation factor G-like protein